MPSARQSRDSVPPLDLALLYDLPSLELRARYIMDGFLTGAHRSPRKGFSVEFAEYRAYQLGDDLRRIDWRLYGRTDRLHVKQVRAGNAVARLPRARCQRFDGLFPAGP